MLLHIFVRTAVGCDKKNLRPLACVIGFQTRTCGQGPQSPDDSREKDLYTVVHVGCSHLGSRA